MTHNDLCSILVKTANVRNALTYTGIVAGGLAGKMLSPITMGPDYNDAESKKRKALNEIANVAAGAIIGAITAHGGMYALKRM